MLRRDTLMMLGALPLALAGCAGGPGAPAHGGWFGSGLSPALEAQRLRLTDALRGTPVVVEATGQRQLRVVVPSRHAFEPGRAAVKPALGAVLDQLAIGFKPYAANTELHIGAPDDGKSSPRVVKERGASMRDHLVGRGVPVSRITGLGRAEGGGVEILLGDRPLNKERQ